MVDIKEKWSMEDVARKINKLARGYNDIMVRLEEIDDKIGNIVSSILDE